MNGQLEIGEKIYLGDTLKILSSNYRHKEKIIAGFYTYNLAYTQPSMIRVTNATQKIYTRTRMLLTEKIRTYDK